MATLLPESVRRPGAESAEVGVSVEQRTNRNPRRLRSAGIFSFIAIMIMEDSRKTVKEAEAVGIENITCYQFAKTEVYRNDD